MQQKSKRRAQGDRMVTNAQAPTKRASGQMLAGQLLGQLSLVVVIPLLTRIFSPSEMGPYQVATSVALILQPLSTFCLELVIPLAATQRMFVRYCRIGALGVGGFGVIFLFAGGALIVTASVPTGKVLVMCALLIVAYGWTVVDNAMLIRRGLHSRLAARNLLSGTIAAGLQLVGATLTDSVLSLALAILVARAVSILVTRPRHAEPLPAESSHPHEHAYTPGRAAFTISSNVVGSGSMQVLTVLGGAVLGLASAGYIGIAQRVAGTPISLLGIGLSQLIQAHTAPIVRERQPTLTQAVRRNLVPLSLVAACAIAGLAIFGPLLAVPLLGPGWKIAGYATAILAVPMSLQLVVSPVMAIMVMLGRERVLLGLQAGRFGLSIFGCILAVALHQGVLVICGAFAAALTISYAVILTVVMLETRRYDRNAAQALAAISLEQHRAK
jgi:O-antigen/teichoic acid export membrane protein